MGFKEWHEQFDCRQIRPLIICRGPVRKEAMDIFSGMGINHVGILLSEKDAIFHPRAVAPELRQIDPQRVHRVAEYTGLDQATRLARISEIIHIARAHHYNAIFAGYGFMAEEASLVAAIETAGLIFIGPCSHTVAVAGQKDAAKRIATQVGVSTIPGVDRLSANTLLAAYPTFIDLQYIADQHDLAVDFNALQAVQDMSVIAEVVLEAAMTKGVELFTLEALSRQAVLEISAIYRRYPTHRVRLKAILGGGGKGQRIVASPAQFEGDLEARIRQATANVSDLVVSLLSEVKSLGLHDNKNILIELNMESTRHQEVQLIGNGEWALAMGVRDCSLQMHEQKLLEFSQTEEALVAEIDALIVLGSHAEAAALKGDLAVLQAMEQEAVRFAEAVQLDSVSTFECILSDEQHYFMEMNTRIQVEHRVTELCYALRFTNPMNADDYFEVDTIIELMVLMALHKTRLPRPQRIPRAMASVELRLNATHQALQPHAGGEIRYWSPAITDEIRDDQGISVRHPDTGAFQHYYISGAYDSNIALLLTAGASRYDVLVKMAEIVRQMQISGIELETNLDFHYGLLNWLLQKGVYAKVTTDFVKQYLTLVGAVKARVDQIDWQVVNSLLLEQHSRQFGEAVVQPILQAKANLMHRMLSQLVARPHLLSAWLSMVGNQLSIEGDDAHLQLTWQENPIQWVQQTYHLLNMDSREGRAPAEVIWCEDAVWLEEALHFYQSLVVIAERCHVNGYAQLQQWLKQAVMPELLAAETVHGQPCNQALWQSLQSTHLGYQLGLEAMALLPLIAWESGFYDLGVNASLCVQRPTTYVTRVDSVIQRVDWNIQDPSWQSKMLKHLEPALELHDNLIVAASGGMFYLQPTPDQAPFVHEGSYFKKGDPLYIIEVMKMFNTVRAPFSGRIESILIEPVPGVVVKVGQPLFEVVQADRAKSNMGCCHIEEDNRPEMDHYQALLLVL